VNRRVVVTGIGAVTPVGFGVEGLWSGVLSGYSAVRRATRFDASSFRSQLAAEIDGFDPLDYMDAKAARRMDRCGQLGVAAARGAMEDANLRNGLANRGRMAVSVGSALGGVAHAEEQHASFMELGLRGVGASLAISVYGGAAAANVAIELGLRGPNLAHSNSCASGAVAVGEGMRLVQRGEADMVLAGGTEAPLAPLTFGAFSLIRAMSSRNHDPCHASRPFDRERDGFVMGEGAAFMVLEERDSALRRDARIYAEITGYAQTNDAYHMTAPRPDGSEAGRAIVASLRDAHISAGQVDYLNAHATGTPVGDIAETRAIERAMGAQVRCVHVSGTKGLYGHPLGASGAIEAALSSLVLQRGFAPGTVNLERPEPCCTLNLIPPAGREIQARHAVSTSFGFGGANAALVFSAHEGR
jgi:3-oxoacyl-[acyl-carrier-protein] synthase II